MPARRKTARKTRSPRSPRPVVVGWKEYVDFPDWDLKNIKAKIDTGARTSAVHVEEYALYDEAGKRTMAELHLALDRRRPRRLTVVRTPILRMVLVKDSGGHVQCRPLVATRLLLGGVRKMVLFTVTNRSSMLFRVLLGRRALSSRFIVDVSKKYVTRKR